MSEMTQNSDKTDDQEIDTTFNEGDDGVLNFSNIKENTHVPTVMLANVFLYLDKKDRLNCKLVCKHWFSALMTDVYFKKDRHLFINHCVLEESSPPLSVFANAPYGYSMITIGADVVLGNENIDWNYFGNNITYLDLAQKSPIMTAKYVKMFTSMPCIKILRVHNDGPLYAGLFGRAMEQLASQNIQLQLEELRVECVNCNPIRKEYFDVFPKIIAVSQNLKKIHIESIRLGLIPQLKLFKDDYPNIKITINLVCHSDPCHPLKPIDLDGICVEHLEFSYDRSKPALLENYLDKCNTVKSIDLKCNIYPSDRVKNLVTKFHMDFRATQDCSSIESFPKLKEMTFAWLKNCVNLHSPMCQLGVSKLAIKTWCLFNCDQCIKGMMLSFPNINELSIRYDDMSKDTLTLILKTLSLYKNLQKLSINAEDTVCSTLNTSLERQPKFYTFSITEFYAHFFELNESVTRSLCQKFAWTKSLTLVLMNMRAVGIAISILHTVLTEMLALKHITCHFFFYDEDIIEIEGVLNECGQRLKTISLPFVQFDKCQVEKIFDKLPVLHSMISKDLIATRAENGTIYVKKNKDKKQVPTNCSEPATSSDNEDNHMPIEVFDRYRHEHQNFIDEARNRRHIELRMRLQRNGVHANYIVDHNHAVMRDQLRNARRQARFRQRNMEN